MPRARLRLLGGFELTDKEGATAEFTSRKGRALLAFLALNSDRHHERGELAALLWGGRGEAQARDSLKQCLLALRKVTGDRTGEILETDRDGVTLHGEAIEVDVSRLRRLAESDEVEDLAEVARLYRGELLAGFVSSEEAFEDWLQVERQNTLRTVVEGLSKLVEILLENGDGEAAVASAETLVSLDPLGEPAHRLLMRSYNLARRRSAALEQYQTLQQVLRQELGVEPEAETKALLQAIKIQEGDDKRLDGTAPAASEPTPKRDLGEHEEYPTLPDKPSIAVLAFENMSGDPEQEYFADGITEDIITELSRFRSLFVIARNSSFTFKGQSVDVGEIGRKLGVQYVVEGSVRKTGNRVRITAQLVEAETGNHLWAERYDRDLEDIFAVQDEVTQAIASILPTKVGLAVFARARRKPTDNLTAYDYLLRGERYLRENAGNPEALKMFEKAIEIDPQCVRAYAHSAVHYLYQVLASGMPLEESTRKAQEQIDRALAIDDDDSSIHSVAGIAYLMLGQHDRAKIHSERAIALNPNDASAIFRHGIVVNYLGDAVGGLEWLRKGRRLDPFEREAFVEDWLEAYYMSRQYEKAIEAFRHYRKPPSHMYAELAACYAQLGRIDEAQVAVAEYERQRPEDYNFAKLVAAHIILCARQEDSDHWLEGYRKAGLPV